MEEGEKKGKEGRWGSLPYLDRGLVFYFYLILFYFMLDFFAF